MNATHTEFAFASRFEEARRALGVSPDEFLELTLGEVIERLVLGLPPKRTKHTRGEIADAIEHRDLASAMHLLEDLYDLGPSCVAWGDESVTGAPATTEAERTEDRRRTVGEERDS